MGAATIAAHTRSPECQEPSFGLNLAICWQLVAREGDLLVSGRAHLLTSRSKLRVASVACNLGLHSRTRPEFVRAQKPTGEHS